jgi:prepilin-type N-terminal cleavage/methylation domain-containing protein
MKKKRSGAFTLVELLIVISVIGILAVVLMPSIMEAPVSARDASRKIALENVVEAIEAYKANNAGINPSTTSACLTDSSSLIGISDHITGGLDALISQKNIQAPDAVMGTCNNTNIKSIFYRRVDNNKYSVCTYLEKAGSGSGYFASIASLSPYDLTVLASGSTSKIYCIVME